MSNCIAQVTARLRLCRHWNFFFTLFFVLFAGFVLVNFVRSWTGQALVGAGVLAYYQFLLWFGLAE